MRKATDLYIARGLGRPLTVTGVLCLCVCVCVHSAAGGRGGGGGGAAVYVCD